MQRGGAVVSRPGQLARVSRSDPQTGTGAALRSVTFTSVDVAARHGRRQALVVVDPPVPTPTARELLRETTGDAHRFRAVVLMPPRQDWDPPISQCMEVAAPGEASP